MLDWAIPAHVTAEGLSSPCRGEMTVLPVPKPSDSNEGAYLSRYGGGFGNPSSGQEAKRSKVQGGEQMSESMDNLARSYLRIVQEMTDIVTGTAGETSCMKDEDGALLQQVGQH